MQKKSQFLFNHKTWQIGSIGSIVRIYIYIYALYVDIYLYIRNNSYNILCHDTSSPCQNYSLHPTVDILNFTVELAIFKQNLDFDEPNIATVPLEEVVPV